MIWFEYVFDDLLLCMTCLSEDGLNCSLVQPGYTTSNKSTKMEPPFGFTPLRFIFSSLTPLCCVGSSVVCRSTSDAALLTGSAHPFLTSLPPTVSLCHPSPPLLPSSWFFLCIFYSSVIFFNTHAVHVHTMCCTSFSSCSAWSSLMHTVILTACC